MSDPTTSRTRMTHECRRWIGVIGLARTCEYELVLLPPPGSAPCAPAYARPWNQSSSPIEMATGRGAAAGLPAVVAGWIDAPTAPARLDRRLPRRRLLHGAHAAFAPLRRRPRAVHGRCGGALGRLRCRHAGGGAAGRGHG